MSFVTDSFFLLSLAGAVLGVTGALGTRRFAHRSRPIAFRRLRRRLVPLLLIPVVGLCGFAFMRDGTAILAWWRVTILLTLVPTGLIWAALGIPGRLAVLPLRILLLLAVATVPLTGALFPGGFPPVSTAGDFAPLLLVEQEPEREPERVAITLHGGVGDPLGPIFSVEAGERILVKADVIGGAPPLWWLPAPGTIASLTVQIQSGGEELSLIVPPPAQVLPERLYLRFPRDALEQVLVARGLFYRREVTALIPGRRGLFLQPGRYALYPGGEQRTEPRSADFPPHSEALSYRYTKQ